MKLTNIKCKTSKPADKPYKLSDGQGMYLDVRPNGSKYWRLKYRVNGKEKLLALGVYPETTITKARDKRAEARKLIGEGIDPSQHRKKEKALALESTKNTFEAVARDWYENRKSRWRPHYAKEIIAVSHLVWSNHISSDSMWRRWIFF